MPSMPGARSGASRGQAMVEFALVLPILALLLLLAIDFGRVFFGWVGLQNAARIGANYASLYPLTDWGDSSDPDWVAYNAQMAADAAGINCAIDTSEPPEFPAGTDFGDPVTVNLSCDFDLITPFVAQVTGSPIELNASATFPIRSGIVGDTGGGGGGGGGSGETFERTVPDLSGLTFADARKAWATAGFLGAFSPATGQDSKLVTTQTMSPTATVGSDVSPLTTVTVTGVTAPNCSGGRLLMPKLIGLTVADARARWAANGFPAAGFTPATGSSDQMVTDQTETPDTTWGQCVASTTTVSVTYEAPPTQLCLVPDLVGVRTSDAQSDWYAAGFTTTVQFNPTGTYRIGGQDVVKNSAAYCDSTVITVNP